MEETRLIRLIRAEVAILHAIADLADEPDLAETLRDVAVRVATAYGVEG